MGTVDLAHDPALDRLAPSSCCAKASRAQKSVSASSTKRDPPAASLTSACAHRSGSGGNQGRLLTVPVWDDVCERWPSTSLDIPLRSALVSLSLSCS